MTQQEKQLLIKDLCARLPYGVRIAYKENEHDIHHWTLCTLHAPHISKDGTIIDTGGDGWIEYVEYPGAGMETASRPLHLEKMLPYLRPMSSMTEEEREEIEVFIFNEWFQEDSCKIDKEGWIEILANYDVSGIDPCFCSDYVDWLNEHHFDYRGLIEKGLALEAKDGMYETE